jgi:hypothetical protein
MFSFLHAADIHLDSPLRGLEVYPDAPVEQIRCAAKKTNLINSRKKSRKAFQNIDIV